ncbi:MAG: aminotransferase class I/II-fold pyridoxal phosphate-dependent enzyme [Planctomycetales bacterium]|nr:aminotransferase class I/II-fold pyridoxal phosphate-dependent enzyme [Planctomycetales bacterium]
MPVVDLRSDTVTRPTPAMRQAMADAEVGDSQYGEDPTTNRLQDRVAELLGKEAAIFFPSGTQSNQAALMTLTRPGDEAIISREAHAAWHEAGGSALNAGVQMVEVGDKGRFTAGQMLAAIKPSSLPVFPRTTLVEVENTHNRMGGIVVPQDEVDAICAAARDNGLNTFLDGARLWNAAVATGISPADWAQHFDTVSVCFSKGLGAPVGSALCGPRTVIERARRVRKALGGGMRQAGLLAAGALYALENHVERLAEDHANAKTLAAAIAATDGLALDPPHVDTNIVIFRVEAELGTAVRFVAALEQQGVRSLAIGPQQVRLVTHLDVNREQVTRAAETIREVADQAIAGNLPEAVGAAY